MNYRCVACSHSWSGRGEREARQCPHCWGRAFISEEEMRLASIALAPLAHLWRGERPPLPNPAKVIAGPIAAVTLMRVIARMKNPQERRAAALVILSASGEFTEEVAHDLAAKMYP